MLHAEADTLGDDHHAQVAARRDERANELLLHDHRIDGAHERHVDLRDVRLEQGKARQTRIAGAKIMILLDRSSEHLNTCTRDDPAEALQGQHL